MILVTGAAGTIGQEVVKALVERGVRFRAGHRRRPVQVPTGSESVEVDFTRPQTLPPALRGVET
ncbi:MAG TPA: NAD-dependent epimerase/dehydratase family protein, partial [Vicinamibacteria bacterium]|nr:NAD-dependent epimerase/dehydratase family protein [Vicinamibacteria bacterium]